ncbi:transmembrane protein 26-like isoform X2 [Lineus longissimus]
MSVWRVATVKGEVYWYLMLLVIFLIIDTVFTIAKRKGQEFKWASTSFLTFLIAAVPPIWLLELHRFERYHQLKDATNRTDDESKAEGLASLAGFNIPLLLESDMWVKILQQTFILLLIPVRWILPRGKITRDRLSQILLVYIALGADIIELLDVYDIPAVMEDKAVFIAVLAVWTVSLIQFIFLLASSGARRSRMAFFTPENKQHSHMLLSHRKTSISPTIDDNEERRCDKVEVSALVMTLFLQDIPFLVVRLYIMISFKEFSNTLLFFVSKNIFTIILQFYRMCIVGCCEEESDDDDLDGLADEMQDKNPENKATVVQVQEASHNEPAEEQVHSLDIKTPPGATEKVTNVSAVISVAEAKDSAV